MILVLSIKKLSTHQAKTDTPIKRVRDKQVKVNPISRLQLSQRILGEAEYSTLAFQSET